MEQWGPLCGLLGIITFSQIFSPVEISESLRMNPTLTLHLHDMVYLNISSFETTLPRLKRWLSGQDMHVLLQKTGFLAPMPGTSQLPVMQVFGDRRPLASKSICTHMHMAISMHKIKIKINL